jgi:transcriptional regulator with PAS, ATPase and Fis domain
MICATNQDLKKLVEKGKFRQDLYYRINVFPIETPALRDRPEDIAPLAAHFLKRLSGGIDVKMTDGAVRTLTAYKWPGNVRELANAVERVMILYNGDGMVTAETLSFLRSSASAPCDQSFFKLPPEGVQLEALEQELVRQALEATGNNQTAAAKLLGLTRAKFRVLARLAADDQ